MTPLGTARHLLARALGVSNGAGSRCACCGDSPFDRAGPAHRVLGGNFADFGSLIAPDASDICLGCQRILAGRPGDTPPPLRTRSLAVIDGELHLPDYAAFWSLLTDPPNALTVLSWAMTRQRHHVLHAELSTPTRLRVGSDGGTIDVRPARDRCLIAAILRLRRADAKGFGWCTRDEILSGHYRASAIAQAAHAWAESEAVVATVRGSPLLGLLVAHAPILPDSTSRTDDTMLDPIDQTAADLLGHLARDSGYRVSHGKEFWGGVFARRVGRHAWRPLPAFVARMLVDCEVAPHAPGAQSALGIVRELDEATARDVMRRLTERTSLLIAIAYDAHAQAKAARTAKPAPPRMAVSLTSSSTPALDL